MLEPFRERQGWKGYHKDTFEKAEARLYDCMKAGFMPMAMLYRDQTGERDPAGVDSFRVAVGETGGNIDQIQRNDSKGGAKCSYHRLTLFALLNSETKYGAFRGRNIQ